jgi:lysozyme
MKMEGNKVDNKKTIASGAAAIVVAIAAFIMPFEGLRTKAYPDPANPHLATICYGETQGVHFGDTATKEECVETLVARIPDYLVPIDKMLPGLPDERRIAYADAAWNMGVGIIKRRSKDQAGNEIPGTSIYDMEKAGNWQGACKRLLVFITADGKVFKGLVRRRQAEYRLCMGET